MADYGTVNDVFAKRLTDREVGAKLERNILGLVERGITPSVMDVRYVKLCRYENTEEDLKAAYSDIFDMNDENYE
jgi:hypothetical protein